MSKWKIEKIKRKHWVSTSPILKDMKWIAYPKVDPIDLYLFETKPEAQEFVKMRYPTIKVDGNKIRLNEEYFDWVLDRVKTSIRMDEKENDLGLSKTDIDLLAWNCAVMVYPTPDCPVEFVKKQEGEKDES